MENRSPRQISIGIVPTVDGWEVVAWLDDTPIERAGPFGKKEARLKAQEVARRVEAKYPRLMRVH